MSQRVSYWQKETFFKLFYFLYYFSFFLLGEKKIKRSALCLHIELLPNFSSRREVAVSVQYRYSAHKIWLMTDVCVCVWFLITECLGLEGSLVMVVSSLLSKAGVSRAGCSGSSPFGFWVTPRMETPQPLWATSSQGTDTSPPSPLYFRLNRVLVHWLICSLCKV